MRAPDPATHRCPLEQLDYDLVAHGTIRCAPERGGCGRLWIFVAGRGWAPSPSPVGAPFRQGARRVAAPAASGAGPW